MIKETTNRIEKLAKRCVELDSIIASVGNNVKVVMYFRIKKGNVLAEIEKLIISSNQEAEKPSPVLEEVTS